MTDPVNSPLVESWRPQRRPSVLDGWGPRLALAGLGLAAVLGAGFGGYSLLHRAPGPVPVIEPDSRPLRIRPDNPGGMQVAGAEEAIMGGGGGRPDSMAPPPEVPQPQVLRAQVEAARQPAAPSPAEPAPLPAPPQPAALPPPDARPAAVPPPPAARAAAAAPRPGVGTVEVQLAAMDSEAAAMAEWQHLAKRMPDLLSARHPAVVRADRDGKPLFRLRTGSFADAAQAASFCAQVRAKGGGCAVASF